MTAAWCGCGGSREDSSAEIDRKMLASGTDPPVSSRMRDGASLSRKDQEPSGRRKYAPAVREMSQEAAIPRVLRGDAAPHDVKFAKRRVSPVLPIRDQVTSVRQSASDSQSVSYFTVPPRAHPSSELFRRQYLSEGGGI